MPENINKDLNMAIVATKAEKKMSLIKEDRGIRARVFTVRKSRGGTPRN